MISYTSKSPFGLLLSLGSSEVSLFPSLLRTGDYDNVQLNYKALLWTILGMLAVRTILKFTFVRTPPRHDQSSYESTISPPSSIFTSLANTVYFLISPKAFILSYKSVFPHLYFRTTVAKHIRNNAGKQSPARMDLATESVHLIQGKEYITRLWRVSSSSRALALHVFLFKHWFAMPQKLIDSYLADDSGYGPKPHPMSTVKPQNRTDRLSHLVFKDVLSGPDTASLCGRFVSRLCNELNKSNINKSWTSRPDFVAFFQDALTVANTESLWGTRLTENSNFCGDITKMIKYMRFFTYRLPRWLIPRAFARRDGLLHDLRQWQSFGTTDTNRGVVPWEDDNYDAMKYGSKRIRKWQTEFLQMDDADADGLASVHLTFVWA
jgi:hypothetical protein